MKRSTDRPRSGLFAKALAKMTFGKKALAMLPLALLGALLIASCDGFLEKEPIGSLDASTYYNTEEDFAKAMYGAYAPQLDMYYQQFGNGWFQTKLYASDDLADNPTKPRAESKDMDHFNWTAADPSSHFSNIWVNAYEGIANANLVINRLETADNFTDESNKVLFRAEARFMRSYYHFMLTRIFGNPPVVRSYLALDIDSVNVGNTGQDPQAVWDLMEEDFAFAAENLPAERSSAAAGRATSGTAAAYLGKVNLFRGQWYGQNAGDGNNYQQAVDAFEQVINQGTHELVSEYDSNFEVESENNDESLYEVQHSAGKDGFINPWAFTPPGGGNGSARTLIQGAANGGAPGTDGQGYGLMQVTQSLQDEFEENDPRRFFSYFEEGEVYATPDGDTTVYQSEFAPVAGSTPSKYNRPFPLDLFPPPVSYNNERHMRYADVLLMKAEAELLTGNAGEAASLINQVRQRARNNYDHACSEGAVNLACDDESITATSTDDSGDFDVLPEVDAGDLTHADIRHERRVEFAFEGHRYDDLVRWHLADGINFNINNDVDFGPDADENWTETNLLRPVPQRRLDTNPNLAQNCDYQDTDNCFDLF